MGGPANVCRSMPRCATSAASCTMGSTKPSWPVHWNSIHGNRILTTRKSAPEPGRLTMNLDPCIDRSQSPRQDYFLNFQFHVPAGLPPGLYTLLVTVKDVTPAAPGQPSCAAGGEAVAGLQGVPAQRETQAVKAIQRRLADRSGRQSPLRRDVPGWDERSPDHRPMNHHVTITPASRGQTRSTTRKKTAAPFAAGACRRVGNQLRRVLQQPGRRDGRLCRSPSRSLICLLRLGQHGRGRPVSSGDWRRVRSSVAEPAAAAVRRSSHREASGGTAPGRPGSLPAAAAATGAGAGVVGPTAGLNRGISSSRGGAIGSAVHAASASITSAGRLIPLRRVLRHHLRDDRRQALGDVGPELPHRRRLAHLVPDQLLRDLPLGKGRLAGQQEVERRPQAVDVRADVHVVAVQRLLRRRGSRRCPARCCRRT